MNWTSPTIGIERRRERGRVDQKIETGCLPFGGSEGLGVREKRKEKKEHEGQALCLHKFLQSGHFSPAGMMTIRKIELSRFQDMVATHPGDPGVPVGYDKSDPTSYTTYPEKLLMHK